MLFLLFLCFLCLSILLYLRGTRDVFSPALLFLLVYSVSTGCALLNADRWGIALHPVTFAVLLIGAVEFVTIALLVDRHYRRTVLRDDSRKRVPAGKTICIQKWKRILTYLGCGIYIVLLYREVETIAGDQGAYEGFSQMLNFFRLATSVTHSASVPWWLSQMGRIVMLCAYIYLYVFLNNILLAQKSGLPVQLRKNCMELFPMLIYLASGILYSDRLLILQTLVAGIIMFFILWVHKTGRDSISLKTIAVLAGAACAGLLLFYWSAEKIGRITDKSMFEYITYYCGSAIECFNQFIQHPPEPSDIIGKETFYNLNRKLYDSGYLQMESFYPIHLEFRYYGDVMLGNVYTAYRRWIYDFGFTGAFLLQGIMAFVMSVFYNRVKYSRLKNQAFWLILYGYLAYTIVFHPYDGYLYLQYASQTFLTTALLLWCGCWFFIEMRLHWNGGFTLIVNQTWKIEGWKLQRR